MTFTATGPDINDLLTLARIEASGEGDIRLEGQLAASDNEPLQLDIEGNVGQLEVDAKASFSNLADFETVSQYEVIFLPCRAYEAEFMANETYVENLRRWIEARFAKRLTPRSLSRILRREGFSRQTTRPVHPKTDEAAQRRFVKGGSARR